MNKGELVAALAAKTQLTKKDSENALNAILDVITESMAKGDKVQLIGSQMLRLSTIRAFRDLGDLFHCDAHD